MGDHLKIGAENGEPKNVLILVSYLISKFYFDLPDIKLAMFPDTILSLLYNSILCIILTNYSFSL